MLPGLAMPVLPLSVSMLGAPGHELRERVEWAASMGFRGVQFNAAAAGSRPRELGRSARRDLAALLRRLELVCSGVDLFIPPAHLADPAHADRAAAALEAAIDFAADLADLTGGHAVLSVELPARTEKPGAGIDPAPLVRALSERASSRGARIADLAWPPTWGADADHATAPLGVGIDPAAVLLAGGDPAREVSRRGLALAAVRLSDLTSDGRVTPGSGRLDRLAFSAAVATSGFAGLVTLDLRGLRDPERAAREVVGARG